MLILFSNVRYAANASGILPVVEQNHCTSAGTAGTPATGHYVTYIKFLMLPSLAHAHTATQRWERKLYWWINGVLIFLTDLHKKPIVQAGGGGQNSSHNWAASYDSFPVCLSRRW